MPMRSSSRTAIAIFATMVEGWLTGRPQAILWKERACDRASKNRWQLPIWLDGDDLCPLTGSQLSLAFWRSDALHHRRYVLCGSAALADVEWRAEPPGIGDCAGRLWRVRCLAARGGLGTPGSLHRAFSPRLLRDPARSALPGGVASGQCAQYLVLPIGGAGRFSHRGGGRQ